ncbi:carbohydrate ABC transporter permease [Halobaculum sp. CBA1158]|uniref:carbohydrate ABC transporter permease n=1 Tax=Halobaculum sp. CBA1158 TaxID=2904243 RepID=UPI001F218837|nr:carbohydrate ABC transporter permease [Halobaculum sp. CBA1158]UIO98814.1 carbohydrate ABC transporter permease [Halobaculum sp. CBA1158]
MSEAIHDDTAGNATDESDGPESRSDGLLDGIDGYRVALYAALLGLVAFYLTPIESGLVTAFKTNPEGVSSTLPFAPPPPQFFTLEKWQTAISALGRGMVNSALYAVPATIISALLGSFAAYGLTQADWRARYKAPVLALLVAGIFIPYQAVLVPLSQFWGSVPLAELLTPLWLLGVPRDYVGIVELTITHVAYGIPICMVLFRSYYRNVSEEMIEAARLDGATFRRTYRRIIFPISTPMFAVVLIYQFTQIWNDLLFALIIVSTESSPAAPVVLVLAGLGESMEGQDFALRMAGAFVAALPTLIVYIMFGEEFAEGVAT